MKPGKRLREGRENDAPAKRTLPAHHCSTQIAASPGNVKSGHPHGIQGHVDLDYSDEPMTEAVPSRQMICYGALFETKAKASFLKHANVSALPWSRFHAFQVAQRGGLYCLLELAEGVEHNFAELDVLTTSHLRALSKFQDISFNAVINSASLEKVSRKKTKKTTVIDVTINILGPEVLAEDVGERLADSSAYLQHPVFLQAGIRYLNPHYFYLDGIMSDLSHLVGPIQEDARSTRVSQGIENVLQSLGSAMTITNSEEYNIENMANNFLAATKLKRHQIEGIRFVLSREDSGFCHNMNRDLLNLIDPSLSRHLSPCLGGIIADAMGLGKTLTMLGAIVCAKLTANGRLDRDGAEPTSPVLTNATLVVLPSKQVLDVWDFEIKRHFKSHTLDVGFFHGDGRAKTPDVLIEHDVVLTTYRTLAADWRGKKVLQNIAWLRVTLDEAHCIRNEDTKLFKAVESLTAERRWCLTGTPIQNSLHDLRSLMRFLRHTPLMGTKVFEKHIIDPIRNESEDHEQFRNLQLLLRVICLRRSEKCLKLPPSVTEMVPVVQTKEESAQYQKILEDCQKEFDRQVCTNPNQSKSLILFATIIKLRRLCNHGTIPQENTDRVSPIPWNKSSKQRKASTITGNEPCGFCSTAEGDTEIFDGIDECPQCGALLNTSASPQTQDCEMKLSFYDGNMLGASGRTPMAWPPLAGSSIAGIPGFSSKLFAVVQNIEVSCSNRSSKSVVFSSWRLTLDILDRMLSQRGISSLRIDGRVKPEDRTAIISRFREDMGASALLMTIDSGAVGLTLTNANRVHIVEPHWNPALEAQAIARVLRMGQTQTVTIVKYITERTVEQNIVKLQEKKSRIAKVSLDSTSNGDATGLLDDLKFVLDA
ncbi:SNF2 family N-terminal domain-containing protein [Ilyonectria robusta]|uniref:SNF2 family N-terminal domain-containing protein n=1 Tax=Ilyonectria robusta TaxID=1079257 RepID=UPI001E8CCC65|nr:SNF2 family N-terminal domain-containing protein [Ilyonectria robusta]KAH8706297.1 SNF2 family N-terminal domain-containing protein [Ilyonectria robusta]